MIDLITTYRERALAERLLGVLNTERLSYSPTTSIDDDYIRGFAWAHNAEVDELLDSAYDYASNEEIIEQNAWLRKDLNSPSTKTLKALRIGLSAKFGWRINRRAAYRKHVYNPLKAVLEEPDVIEQLINQEEELYELQDE